jgi:uncharacterized protein YdaU (DUF1376 family)
MAASWQRWMPFHIDRFRGSPSVQAMHPAARAGFLYLLGAAWQTEDCALPDDDDELSVLSGLGSLWQEHAAVLRRKFRLENGRLRNDVLLAEWQTAKRTFERRKDAAERTNSVRMPRKNASKHAGLNGDRDGDRDGDRHTVTGTDTRTIKRKAKAQAPFVLPVWIPAAAWSGYVEMRQRIRRPMTDKARSIAVQKLESLRHEGQSPAAVLEQSTFNSWQGLFPVRETTTSESRSRPRLQTGIQQPGAQDPLQDCAELVIRNYRCDNPGEAVRKAKEDGFLKIYGVEPEPLLERLMSLPAVQQQLPTQNGRLRVVNGGIQ